MLAMPQRKKRLVTRMNGIRYFFPVLDGAETVVSVCSIVYDVLVPRTKAQLIQCVDRSVEMNVSSIDVNKLACRMTGPLR